MYHEEAVINGVLCWRGTPDGEWQKYTLEALTIALTAERGRSRGFESAAIVAGEKLVLVKRAIDG